MKIVRFLFILTGMIIFWFVIVEIPYLTCIASVEAERIDIESYETEDDDGDRDTEYKGLFAYEINGRTHEFWDKGYSSVMNIPRTQVVKYNPLIPFIRYNFDSYMWWSIGTLIVGWFVSYVTVNSIEASLRPKKTVYWQ